MRAIRETLAITSITQSANDKFEIHQETVEMVNKQGSKATAFTVDMSNK